MSDERSTIIMPDNQNNGWGSIPAVWALGPGYGWGNGGYGYGGGWGNGFFGGGFGNGFLGGILGGLIPGFFNGGLGNWGGNGNGAAAASLGAQATANANSEMILNAINGTDADVRLLATTLNGDVDSIRLAINTVQGAIANVANQTGLTGLQVINELQSGNATIARQICECCCAQKQLTVEQGYQNQLATLNQTSTLMSGIADLKATMIDQFCAAEKRDMQDKINTQGDIITQLRGQLDNDRQTLQLQAMLSPIAKEVNDIKCQLPQTVPVTWPNIQAVNTTPYAGNFYNGFGWGFGNGVAF